MTGDTLMNVNRVLRNKEGMETQAIWMEHREGTGDFIGAQKKPRVHRVFQWKTVKIQGIRMKHRENTGNDIEISVINLKF